MSVLVLDARAASEYLPAAHQNDLLSKREIETKGLLLEVA